MTDYPDELDTDDIGALAAYIERWYPTKEIRMHDTETVHFAYWDVSHRSVSSEFLDHIQAAGYRVLRAGRATVPRRGTQRAWAECRKHKPGEDTDDAERKGFTIICEHCEDEYTPDDARTIVISDPSEARYTCPRCGHGTDGPLPVFNGE
jgi:DNA-directed RNA polymerase subunit RPC12/RpoP